MDDLKIFSDQYQMWLSQLVHGEDHSELMYILFNTEFTWPDWMPMDENRAVDGQYLRVTFAQEEGWEIEPMDGWPCSMLEMLVALAVKIENQLAYDPDAGDRTAEWFWMMLGNMGLDICTDEWFLGERTGFGYVMERVGYFKERKYGKEGAGGPFPLSARGKNMKKAELWCQANWYMHEKVLRFIDEDA